MPSFTDNPQQQNEPEKGRTKKRFIVIAISVFALIAVAVAITVVFVTRRSDDNNDNDRAVKDGDGTNTKLADDDDVPPSAVLYSEPSLLYSELFVNNPSTNYLEASFSLYTRYLLSNPANVSYTVSVEFGAASLLQTTKLLNLCFTDNLYLLERNLENNDDIHVKHPTDKYIFTPVTTKAANNVITTTSNHTLCLHHINTLTFPHTLPPTFHPDNYGAAAIVHTSPPTTTITPPPPYSLGNLFYNTTAQRSMYPNLYTEIESTSEVYIIQGDILTSGEVGRTYDSNSPYSLYDKTTMRFNSIDLAPQPPALFLYLTTRSAWMRFSTDDVFIDMLGDGDLNWPAGSFYEEGSYSHPWPPGEKVDVREYEEGYWYLWCTTFAITLAGGHIQVLQEY